METMKVIILPSGTEAREVNILGDKRPERYEYGDYPESRKAFYSSIKDWDEEEEKCRTFQISGVYQYEFVYQYIPGSIHEAVIISDGSGQAKATIRIID